MAVSLTTLTIAGIDYSYYVDVLTVRFEEGLQGNSDSLSFDIVLDSVTYISGSVPKPLSGQKVVFAMSNGEKFSGILATVEQIPYLNLEKYKFACQTVESTRVFNKHLVIEKGTRVNKNGKPVKQDLGSAYAGDIVKRYVAKYAPEFSTSGVESGYIVPEEVREYEELGSVVDSLAQSIGYMWFIDDYNLIFTSDLKQPAPVPIINIDTDLTLSGFSLTEDTSRLVNRIFIKDFTAKEGGSKDESFIADGNQSFFGLFQEIWDSSSVNVKVTPPDGSSQQYSVYPDPLTTREGDLEGSPGECFVCVINTGIRFPMSDLPDMDSVVDVNYEPVAGEQVIPLEEPDSIRMMRNREAGGLGPTDGIYEKVVSLPEFRVSSLDVIMSYGLLILDRLAWPVVSGQFETKNVTGWKPGQSFTLTSVKRDLYDHKIYWKTGKKISPKMYVQNVSRNYIPTLEHGIMENTVITFSNLVNELLV